MIQWIFGIGCDIGISSGWTIRVSIDLGGGTKKNKSPNAGRAWQCAVEAPVATEQRVLRITKQSSSRNNAGYAEHVVLDTR